MIDSQRLNAALKTGLKLLGSETICTPNAWNSDLTFLEQILANLVTGNMVLGTKNPDGQIIPPEGAKSDEEDELGEGDEND